MRIGEEVSELKAGENFERAITDDIELTLEDIARVKVAGKATGRALQEAADAADTRVRELLELVGLKGGKALERARELVRQRSDAERSRSTATQALQDNLRDLTLELIVEKNERYEKKLAEYQEERDSSTPMPSDLDDAKIMHESASDALAEARRGEEKCQKALEDAEELVSALQSEVDTRTGRLERAQQILESARNQLEGARREKPDDEIAKQRDEDAGASSEAQTAHNRELEELEAADPDSSRALLRNAEDVYERLRNEQSELELEAARIARELDVRGQTGLADQLAAVESELAQLSKTIALADRRAAAVELLYERLTAHREAARRSYVAPFKEQLETFARIVFGPTVSLEIDHETLEVVSRTLDGVTVPYDSLSVGAREQICVLARLACAELVCPASAENEDSGVPVIFDDALGFSDASRLERLGAVFGVASDRSQVIVLTCVPERYKNIGSATVIRFDPNANDPVP